MREPDDLEIIIKRNREDLDELKNIQYVGIASIANYITHTNDDADYVIPLSDLTPSKRYRLSFTHSLSTVGGLFVLKIYGFVNITMTPGSGSPPVQPGGVLGNAYNHVLGVKPWTTGIESIGWAEDMPPTISNTTSWTFKVVNESYDGSPPDPSLNVFLKFIIDGTDTGSWLVTPL